MAEAHGAKSNAQSFSCEKQLIIALLATVALAFLFSAKTGSFSHGSPILFKAFITGHRTNNFNFSASHPDYPAQVLMSLPGSKAQVPPSKPLGIFRV
jgi:hypothetical protein